MILDLKLFFVCLMGVDETLAFAGPEIAIIKPKMLFHIKHLVVHRLSFDWHRY